MIRTLEFRGSAMEEQMREKTAVAISYQTVREED